MDTDRRPITILFTDIVGSTTLAEKLDPEEWQEIVNGAHRRVTDVITRYEGTVAQLLGDGVLAFFGAPRAHEDDPARAVRAGLDIQHEISEYAHELRGYVENFQMRVGINTGHVVVGGVGSAGHMEYLAVGDAVNLAARLQGAAQPGTVLISEVTARLVQSSFDWRDLGEISVKGKAEPVRVFQVIGARAGFSDGRGIAGLTSPLVGRERELGVLRDHLQELRAGQGQIVFVLGEAGIGKSRLVEEARLATGEPPIAETGAQPTQRDSQITIRFLEGRALSYGQALSFWTIRQLLQNDLGLADGEPEIRIQVALRRRVKELFGTRSDEVLPYLAHLLGVQLGGAAAERVAVLDGETLKRQVLLSIVEYIAQLAHRQPTVLVFEDLHWADPSSLNTLERLLRVTDRAPLMVLVLMRPETDKPAWHIREVAARDYRRRFHELQLEALSTESADQMVNHLLAVSALPGSVRQLILERAEGNPFYLEEIIRSLIEQGGIVHD
jgi:class 3 adenylate cyclase